MSAAPSPDYRLEHEKELRRLRRVILDGTLAVATAIKDKRWSRIVQLYGIMGQAACELSANVEDGRAIPGTDEPDNETPGVSVSR